MSTRNLRPRGDAAIPQASRKSSTNPICPGTFKAGAWPQPAISTTRARAAAAHRLRRFAEEQIRIRPAQAQHWNVERVAPRPQIVMLLTAVPVGMTAMPEGRTTSTGVTTAGCRRLLIIIKLVA